MAGLCAVVFVTHYSSLHDGLFFDDHWHRATLRSFGWRFDDLVESATFNLPGELVHLWWQDVPLQWRYARPVAMLMMKIELWITGGSPFGIHLCALFWHMLATILVYKLTAWVIRARYWAFLAACTFAIQPHSVFGVGWIAARNALVSGVFFFAAFYVYAATPIARRRGANVNLRLLASIALWGLALFSRETAIIFPLLVPLLDLMRGGRRLFARRFGYYVLLGGLTVAYLYWRLWIFPIAGPPKIYFTAPAGIAYVPWALAKLLHMLFALIFQTPMFLGLAGYDGSLSTQLVLYGVMAALLLGIAIWFVVTSRGLRTRWLWPLWTAAAFVPVIPVFVMPHFAYLPAAGFTVMMGVMLSRLRKGWRGIVTVLVLGATFWSFTVYRWLWRGVVRGEQLITADITANTPPPPAGSKLFFINLPVAGIYSTVTMRETWQQPDLEGYVLTFAPHPLMMSDACVAEQTSPYELTISMDPPGYFNGLSGRMLLDGMRPDSPLKTGETIPGELFDTTIIEKSDDGITRLRFKFHERLDSPEYYFYLSSPVRPAFRLRFDQASVELDADWMELFRQAHTSDATERAAACDRLYQRIEPLLVQTGDVLNTQIRTADRCSDSAIDRLERWCREHDAPLLFREDTAFRTANAEALRERQFYFQIADFATGLVRSDLYLTSNDER